MDRNFHTALRERIAREGLDDLQAATILLDRLAFGPRPGEARAIAESGLLRWLDDQLCADTPDPGLAERLTGIPAAGMAAEQIVWRYPDLGKVYAHARHNFDLIPPRGALQDFDWAKRKIEKFMREQGLLDQEKALYPELMAQKVMRARYARHQLAEVLADFWFNHFYVSFAKYSARVWILAYERDAIRPHVLGRFRDMLGAGARHPAMLAYLDNSQSVARQESPTFLQARQKLLEEGEAARARMAAVQADLQKVEDEEQIILDKEYRPRAGINENYARELMELHTLGVDGGYTQQDVAEVARAFTGWTVRPFGCTAEWFKDCFESSQDFGFYQHGGFLFRPDWHDAAEKRLLGHVLPPYRGLKDGEEVLDILTAHPSTARFVCRKLAARFICDQPAEELVERLAATFTATEGHLPSVMRALILSPEFWQEGRQRSKVKSPFTYAVSAIRLLDAEIRGTDTLTEWISRMGQPLYGFKAPTGFPDRGEFWINSGALLNRMSFALNLASGGIDGVAVSPARSCIETGLQIAGPPFQHH